MFAAVVFRVGPVHRGEDSRPLGQFVGLLLENLREFLFFDASRGWQVGDGAKLGQLQHVWGEFRNRGAERSAAEATVLLKLRGCAGIDVGMGLQACSKTM